MLGIMGRSNLQCREVMAVTIICVIVLLVSIPMQEANAAPSLCSTIQVFPVHHIGLGSTDEIFLSSSRFPSAPLVLLDGVMCRATQRSSVVGSGYLLSCPILDYPNEPLVEELLQTNGSVVATLTTSRGERCFLNETHDGTLWRHAYLTTLTAGVTMLSVALPRLAVQFSWLPAPYAVDFLDSEESLAMLHASDGGKARLFIGSSNSSSSSGGIASSRALLNYTWRTLLQQNVTFPVFLDGLHGSAWNVSLAHMLSGTLVGRGRWGTAVVPSISTYSGASPSRRTNESCVSMGTAVPAVYSATAQPSFITLLAPDEIVEGYRFTVPLVEVTIVGAFPACATAACRAVSVTLVNPLHRTQTDCTVIAFNSSWLRCMARVSTRTFEDTAEQGVVLPLGLGLVLVNGSRSTITRPAISGWINVGPRSRAVVTVDSTSTVVARVHCTSTDSIQVRDIATGEILCAVHSTSLSGASMSVDITLQDDVLLTPTDVHTIGLDVQCENSSTSLCAVSLEILPSSTTTSQSSTSVAVLEVLHAVSSSEARSFLRRTLRGLEADSYVHVMNVTSDTQLEVPEVNDQHQCTNGSVVALRLGHTHRGALYGRFSPHSTGGVWRGAAGACAWYVVIPVERCADLLAPTPSFAYNWTVVFCGERHRFFDPIPYSLMEVPADAIAVHNGTGHDANRTVVTWIPRVVFPGYPPATPVAENSTTTLASATVVCVLNESSQVGVELTARRSPGGRTMSAFIVSNETELGATVVSIGLARASSVPAVNAETIWVHIRNQTRCTFSTSSRWCSNTTFVVPSTGASAGYYRLVVQLASGGTVLEPAEALALNATTAASFFFIMMTVSSVSVDSVGAYGGGTLTMAGVNFPTPLGAGRTGNNTTSEPNILRMYVRGEDETLLVPSELVSSSQTFLSWTVGDLRNITAPRVLNTLQANWTMCVLAEENSITTISIAKCAQVVNGSVGILLPVALPRITEISPMILSSAALVALTIVGSGLSLKDISMCAEADPSSSLVTPFQQRQVAACEVCTPSFSNSTHVECAVPPAVRFGSFGVYVSAPAIGGGATLDVPLRFVFAVTSVYPTDVSAFGSAVLTVTGVAFTGVDALGWMFRLWQPEHNTFIDCAATTLPSNTTAHCELPTMSPQALGVEGVSFTVVAQHRTLGHTILCSPETPASSCTVTFTTEPLPKLLRVTPTHGQAPLSVTIFGALFTGDMTWVLPNATNLQLFVGTSACIIALPIYFDRIICHLLEPCSSAEHPQIRGLVSPHGITSTEFMAPIRFTCSMSLSSITPTVGSAMGGQVVTIRGNGFPTSTPPHVSVAGIACVPLAARTTQSTIVCRTQSVGSIIDLRGEVKVISQEDETVQASCCSYWYSASLTPTVDSIAPSSGSEGVRATLVGSRFTSGVQVELSGILITDAVVLSETSVNLLIPRLPPASARLQLSIAGVGYAYHAPSLENFSYSLSISRVTPTRGSFQSGLVLTIVGSGLGINASGLTSGTEIIHAPTTEVLICGRVCSILTLEFSSLTCAVPEYVDSFMLQQYPSAAHIINLTAANVSVYRRLLAPMAAQMPAWGDVTGMFVDAPDDDAVGIVAENTSEVFLVAANKHSRLALTKIWLSLGGIRNSSQNVSCGLRRVLASSVLATSLNTLADASSRDWSADSYWSTAEAWNAMGILNGWTSGDVSPRFDVARFFLLRCDKLVPGETVLHGGRISGTVAGISAIGGVCPINVVVTSISQSYHSCNDVSGSACSSFTYDSTATPIVTAYSVPYSLSTAPLRITLAGSGFGLVADSVTNVVTGGLACQVQLAQESTLVCVTQGRVRSPITGSQGLSIIGKGLAKIVALEPFIGSEPWSCPTSWYQSSVPTQGSIVYIPPGTSILLDHSPPELTAIVVAGTLTLQDTPLSVLVCAIIVLDGGTVQGGNYATPLTSSINITFVSNAFLAPASNVEMTPGSPLIVHKMLLALGGFVHLHGAVETIMSSYLQQSATAGSHSIVIQDRVTWVVGAQILITKASPDLGENEQRYIVGKTLVGSTAILELDQPLSFDHTRSTDSYLKNTFEVSSRVILLSRNVMLLGGIDSEQTREGVSVVGTDNARVLLRGVLLDRCGKAARNAARRMHDRVSSSYTASSSLQRDFTGGVGAVELQSVRYQESTDVLLSTVVRRSFGRGIVLRDTRLVSIVSSVVYQTNGHGIAAIGGLNWNVSLQANTVCRSQLSVSEGGEDPFPANYFLTNPMVTFLNNFAFGASGDNVWLQWADDTTFPNPLCPSHRALTMFSGNVLSGALRDGIRITDAWSARARPCVDHQLGMASSNPFVASSIVQTLIFGCRGNGIYAGPLGALSISSCYIIDVLRAGVTIGASAGSITISDTLISGLLSSGSTLLRGTSTRSRDGLVLRSSTAAFTMSSLWIRNATGTSLRVCPTVAAETPPREQPVFITSSKLTISGLNLTTQAALCGTVVLLDVDGSLTQVQREVYIVANHYGALNPKVFTMCRTFHDAAGDLPATVASGLVDGSTGQNATLLLCDTFSTYLFFAVTLTLRGAADSNWQCNASLAGCSRSLAVKIFHDGALVSTFNSTFLPAALNKFNAIIGPSHYTTAGENDELAATFLVVDGRPSTVTAQSNIFSSRLQFVLTPLCSNMTCVSLQPARVILSRVGAARPNFPSQFLIDSRSSSLYAVDVRGLTPQFVLSNLRWSFVWLPLAASVVPLRNPLATDTVQGTLLRRRDTSAWNQSGTSASLISLWFSTTTTVEGIVAFPVFCQPAEWCVPSIYPNSIAAATATTTTYWDNASAWFSLSVPTAQTEVAVVPQGIMMVLNKSVEFALQALVVVGTLVIDADALVVQSSNTSRSSIVVRATQIIVLGTLHIIATLPSASVTIQMITAHDAMIAATSGGSNNTTRPPKCASQGVALVMRPTLRVPCGAMLVAGKVNATGNPRPTWWHTRNAAFAGAVTFDAPLNSSIGLAPLAEGWHVGLATTDPRRPRGEENTIAASLERVQIPWSAHHEATSISSTTHRYPQATSFEKSVQMQCGVSGGGVGNDWNRTNGGVSGCRLVVHRHPDLVAIAALSNNKNELFMSHAMVEGFGLTFSSSTVAAAGTLDLNETVWGSIAERGSPALFISGTATAFVVNHSLIVNSSHMGLLIARSTVSNTTLIKLDNSVVWNTNGSGIALVGSGITLSSVLVAGVTYPRNVNNAISMRPTKPLCSVIDVSGKNILQGVVAGGSEAEGVCIPWSGCTLSQHSSIVAHSSAVGIFLFDPCDLSNDMDGLNCSISPITNMSVSCTTDPTFGGGAVVYRNSFVGVQSTQHAQITLQALTSARNPVGVYATSQLGVSGPTRIVSSMFRGLSSNEPCMSMLCSSNFAFGSPVDCSTTLFTSKFLFVGVMLTPSSMGGVPITYDRSSFPFIGQVVPRWAELNVQRNASAFATVTLTGNSFDSFSSCGYALALNPLALATDAPYIVSSGFRYDTTPNRLFAPTSTFSLPSGENGAPCASDSGACEPYQSLGILDLDGSIRSANATAFLVMDQRGANLLSCSPLTHGLAVCPTTLAYGRLIVQSPDDTRSLSLSCMTATAFYGTVSPVFTACASQSRGVDAVPDPVTSMLLLVGVEVNLVASVVPRRLLWTLSQCTADGASVILTIMMQEVSNVRTTVWVDGAPRAMGLAKPSLTGRYGEWYRNPLRIGDDTEGDAADWTSVVVHCGSTVDLHQLVRGVLTLIMNTSVSLITYGHRQQIGAQLAVLVGRPNTTVFVASAVPANPPTQSVVTVFFEAQDAFDYNATREALLINEALRLVEHDTGPISLTQFFGLIVFSITTTPVTLHTAAEEEPPPFLTLQNVIVFSGGVGGLAAAGVLFYWYLLALRISISRSAKRTYDGITFGQQVDVLPSTEDEASCIEETVPETSSEARLIAYLEDWKIPLSKPIFSDVTMFASSVQCSSASSSASERPLAPLSHAVGASDAVKSREGSTLLTGSVITAFLQLNQNDHRIRSPRQTSLTGQGLYTTPPGGVGPLLSSQRPAALQQFQLDPDAVEPKDSPPSRCSSVPLGCSNVAEHEACSTAPVMPTQPPAAPQVVGHVVDMTEEWTPTPKPIILSTSPPSALQAPLHLSEAPPKRKVSFTFGHPRAQGDAAAQQPVSHSTDNKSTGSASRPPLTPRVVPQDKLSPKPSPMSLDQELPPVAPPLTDCPSSAPRAELPSPPPQPQHPQPAKARRSRFTSSQVNLHQ